MEESEENMSSGGIRIVDSMSAVKKPKKRSLVERELETNMTARITSPVAIGEGLSTSRYGRARRLKTEAELIESQKLLLATMKSPGNDNTPVKVTSPVYRMHASNSPHKAETPKKSPGTYLENQIDNIYQENKSLSRFSEDPVSSPAKKFPKVYIRKDLLPNREEDDNIMLIKNLFSPSKSASKSTAHMGNNSVNSTEKYNAKPNGLIDNSSVVKTLDFDGTKKKKKEDKDQKVGLSKNELFEVEAKCPYQVGDLAWARVGSFPFWPCLITRDPYSDMFVKKKLFGRVEHDLVHVTFFGDNGRRSWIVDNMLRSYLGIKEFIATREQFTPEDKKKDPKLYAAFFVSEKKQPLWNVSVEEAETLLKEPKRLRIDIFNEMLWKSRASKKPPKSGKISRTNSDVSLSESLYDSLFSEKEVKVDDVESSRKARNKSFDVSEVVTACLDNMAAKTGITKIQRQSHMDRWLQKAKSKTPEKTQAKPAVGKLEKPEKALKPSTPVKLVRKSGSKSSTKSSVPANVAKPYRFRKRTVSNSKLTQIESVEMKNETKGEDKKREIINDSISKSEEISSTISKDVSLTNSDANATLNVEKVNDCNQTISEVIIIEDDKNPTQSKNKSVEEVPDEPINSSAIDAVDIKEPEPITDKVTDVEMSVDILPNEPFDNAVVESTTEKGTLLNGNKANSSESLEKATQDISTACDKIITSNKLNLESTEELIQDLSKTIEDADKTNSTSIDFDVTPCLETNNMCPTEESHENLKTSIPDACQNSLMEIDQSKDDVETVQDTNKINNTCGISNNVMEVDECANLEVQANEDTSVNSQNVSNKSVEDDVSTDLKEAQNVTIEVSVTEKNNDDTINQQQREQERTDETNCSKLTETEADALNFLESNNLNNKIHMATPENASVAENYEKHEVLDQNSGKVSIKLLQSATDDNELIELKADTDKNSIINVHKENNETVEDIINDEDKTMHNSNDVLNESTQSESIFCDDPEQNKETILNTSFSDSVISESILENSQINESEHEITSIEESAEKVRTLCNGPEFLTDDVQHDSTRQYVESPTFTQLLDSEEFFRDVNETPNSPIKLDGKEKNQTAEMQVTAREDEKNTHNVENITLTDEDVDEDTSDDEPSPEYESLDDEITEDFRKHMMSIENNIKDKKDEEQIVKICNEIAEKAKLSPTKYTPEQEIVKPVDKLDTSSKSITSSEDKGDEKIKKATKKSDIIHKEEVEDNTMKKDEHCRKENKLCITLIDRFDIRKLNGPYTDFTKKLNRSDKDIRIDKEIVVHKKHEHNSKKPTKENEHISRKPTKENEHNSRKRTQKNEQNSKKPTNKNDLKMNGDATACEILEKPKVIYRTRSSVSSTKDRASPDVKMESSKIERYRKSCEYEPKVVIIRLERDKIENSMGASNAKSVDDDNNKSQIPSTATIEDKVITTNLVENVEVKSISNINKVENEDEKIVNRKTRLSLKRNNPKSNRMEIIDIHNQPKVIVKQSVTMTPKALKEEETMIVTKVPKKIEITNEGCETSIPVPVKVNGYHNALDRKFMNTPDSIEDTDFDVDAVSLNSEDSEISLANSVESIPKRNLRSRPERTLESALRNPEFLKFLELRQDYVMDMYPELNEDEVLSYVHKTWQYEEDLECDTKKSDGIRIKQETPRSKKSKKSQPKNCIENFFREKYEKSKNTTDFGPEITPDTTPVSNEVVDPKVEPNEVDSATKAETPAERKKRPTTPNHIDLTTEVSNETVVVEDKCKVEETTLDKAEGSQTPKRSSRSRMVPKSLDKEIYEVEDTPGEKPTKEREADTESVDSEDSEIPLRQLRSRVLKENKELKKEPTPEKKADVTSSSTEPILENNTKTVCENKVPVMTSEVKDEVDETASTVSDNEPLVRQKNKKVDKNSVKDPAFLQYLEMRQDALMDENPQLTTDEIVRYLHKIWVSEEYSKTALQKNDELKQEALVKGLNNNEVAPVKRSRGRPKIDKQTDDSEAAPKEKPRRRIAQPFYNENYSDIEDELEVFEIFKTKKTAITIVSKTETDKDKSPSSKSSKESPKAVQNAKKELEQISDDDVQFVDETELYFQDLTRPKPNVFKGLIREKVCDICECIGNLVKCKGCHGMFHPDCVKKQAEPVEKPKESDIPLKGRKKKRKPFRKLKSLEDSESHSDDKSHDLSADTSVEDIAPPEICTIDAEYFESQLEIKMKEMITADDINYDSYSSDDGIDWGDSIAGKCEIVDVKLKKRDPPIDYSEYKCHNCQIHSTPVCFVCKSAVSKTDVKMRQKCHIAHCYKYYHLECLDHWPQTQFNSGEPSKNNKKKNEFLESLTCPRHVCHTCVSDDPRGCKTRFSGDKLAKCVRCPATYHSFNKCLPAGSTVLTASHIVCPRHSEQKAGKVPCHVNTGWCFICALGGSLICCEYCPTSFHAECLNISPPEGNYMCEDCETGRLPLYGEMVWVKLGQYRWWPGIILHPSEIPENIMLVKHELGDFVVRFFGQYDHYWVNRGRVFPYQEGDSGRISSQKSKINADFILAIEHAQRAYTILKNASPDEEESLDIASSLLPPHYVKLKSNKPSGALCGKRIEDPSLSLTQCECNPDEPEPCGPYSSCLNRMLLTECGPTCRAGDRCNNRAFEKRLYPKLTPYRTPQRGWGLKTLEDIKAGQFVIEYVGELIDEEEFRRRMRRKHEIRDENFYFLTLDKERMIDAGPKGNAARFMNHCCEPNCETQKWTVLGDVRVGLFAINDIPANSEVTFNYNLECAGIEKKRCLCGAKRCSGYIGAKPKQDESQSKKGKEGKLKRQYNKKKKPEESPTTIKIKKKLGRPPKPKELTDLEKDVLIIKNATNLSEEPKTEEKVKRKSNSNTTEQVSICNGNEEKPKSLKRKREINSISTEEVSISIGEEPSVKKLKCDKPSEVGD